MNSAWKYYRLLDRLVNSSSRNDSWHEDIRGALLDFETSDECKGLPSKRNELIGSARKAIDSYVRKHNLGDDLAKCLPVVPADLLSGRHIVLECDDNIDITCAGKTEDCGSTIAVPDKALECQNIEENCMELKRRVRELEVMLVEVRNSESQFKVANTELFHTINDTQIALQQKESILEQVQAALEVCVREKDEQINMIAVLREGNKSLAEELKRTETEKEQYKSLLRDHYERFIPVEALSVLNLSPEMLGNTGSALRHAALLSLLKLWSADTQAFVQAFQDFDAELSELKFVDDFDVLREQAEKAINVHFLTSGYTVTWDILGKPFDPALHYSSAGQGTTVSGVDRALIMRGVEVVIKAYVSTI